MLDLELAKKFAWILRSDVRKGKHAHEIPDENFKNWWLVSGRAEYPFWSSLTEEEKNELFTPVGKFTIGSTEQTVPKAMQLVLSRRSDVLQKYTKNKVLHIPAAAGWFWIIGIKEHRLIEAVNLNYIRELDRPVLPDASFDPNPKMEVPAPTVLMHLAWHLLDEQNQEIMNLQISEQRYRYFCWFFAWLSNIFEFQHLVSNRWKSWLMQEIPVSDKNPELGELPRFALMELSLSTLKNQQNLSTLEGIKAIKNWGNQISEPGKKWGWIKKKITYLENQLPTETSLGIVNHLTIDQFTNSSDIPLLYDSSNIKNAPRESKNLITNDKEILRESKPTKTVGLNLYGFAYGELGIGEDVRMAAAACDSVGIPYRIVNIDPGKEIGQADQVLKAKIEQSSKDSPYTINVFCMPGFDTASRIFLRIGSHIFKDHYNIGWWPWELSVWPRNWLDAFHLVDEIWAGSQFSFEMYKNALIDFEKTKGIKKKCVLMPLAVSVDRLRESKINFTKEYFGLPKDSFLFLYVFDFSSHILRKNPEALVNAFLAAFDKQSKVKRKNVGLILKVMNADEEDKNWRDFKLLCKKDSRIVLIIKTLERTEVLGLISVCDAYVSPHKAEGFGRTIAEAMLLGKQVIATNYSGNSFFMHPELTSPVKYDLINLEQGSYHFIEPTDLAVWANPSIEDLSNKMQMAFDKTIDNDFISQVKTFSESKFNPENCGSLMKKRLLQLGNSLT